MRPLETAPLWLIALVLTCAFVLAEELGYRAHRMFKARRDAAQADTEGGGGDGIGYLLSAALALLGLLVAFTFSMSAERYNARRLLVVDEANAIGTTYLRTQLLDEPFKGRLSDRIGSYLKAREAFFAAGDDREALALADSRTGELQTQMWSELTAAIRATPTATINPSLLQTYNETFDLASTRRAALDARVPLPILRALIIYAVVTAAIMGYSLAPSRRRYFAASATLFFLVALSITLILDLDRPRSGTVTINQDPMMRAAQSIRQMEGAKALATP